MPPGGPWPMPGEGAGMHGPESGQAGQSGAGDGAQGAAGTGPNDPSPPPRGDSHPSLPAETKREGFGGLGNAWPEETRTAAIRGVADLGSIREVSRIYGIPEQTISRWMAAPEAQGMVDQIRRTHARARSIEAGSLWDRAVTEIRDRLDNGDHVLTKHGDVIRKPVAARDLAVVAGIMADKAAQWQEWAQDAAGGGSNVTPDQFLDVLSNIDTLRAELRRRQEAQVEVQAVIAEPTRVERPGRKVRSDAGSSRGTEGSAGGDS